MECPTCSARLAHDIHEGVEIDRCPEGHGVWLDVGELARVVDSEDQPRPDAERAAAVGHGARAGEPAELEVPPRACPACGRPMDRNVYDEYSGVVIDRCDHGVWLDAGELERVEAWMEGSDAPLEALSERTRHEQAVLRRLDEAIAERAALSPFRRLISAVGQR